MTIRLRKLDRDDRDGYEEELAEYEAACGGRVNGGKDCPSEYRILKAQEKIAKNLPTTGEDLLVFKHESECPYCGKFARSCHRI